VGRSRHVQGRTLIQIVFAFVAGTLFCVTRIASGLLITSMLAHALWDFSLIRIMVRTRRAPAETPA